MDVGQQSARFTSWRKTATPGSPAAPPQGELGRAFATPSTAWAPTSTTTAAEPGRQHRLATGRGGGGVAAAVLLCHPPTDCPGNRPDPHPPPCWRIRRFLPIPDPKNSGSLDLGGKAVPPASRSAQGGKAQGLLTAAEDTMTGHSTRLRARTLVTSCAASSHSKLLLSRPCKSTRRSGNSSQHKPHGPRPSPGCRQRKPIRAPPASTP